MAARDDQRTPIIGYRRDRVGARLIGILNVLRFRALFGHDAARYVWLAQSDGPYPDLADPAEIFAPAFINDVMDIVAEPPELTGRAQLDEPASRQTIAAFAAGLGEGRLWACDAAFDIVRFRDETHASVTAQVRELSSALTLSAKLAAAKDAALSKLTGAGDPEAEPVAIHLRRGDILDGDPWSWQAWPSKYAPDEYYRAFLENVTGPIIAFSDTPEAIAHLGDPRILPASSLIEGHGLTIAQRDVLELLLMASCRRIGAPGTSAFSRAAAVIGRAEVVALPQNLAPDVRRQADLKLLDRALHRQGSFIAGGDLAQSLVHALPTARAEGRAGELLYRFGDMREFLARYPFVASALAELAATNDQPAAAKQFAKSVGLNSRASPRDRIVSAQVKALIAIEEAPDGIEAAEQTFVTDLFVGRRSAGNIMPALGARLLGRNGWAGNALGIPPALVQIISNNAPNTPQSIAFPIWAVQQGWIELVQLDETLRRLRMWPSLHLRLSPVAQLLQDIEPALQAGSPPSLAQETDAALLGWAATGLTLGNKLARSMRLLEWLAERNPSDAISAKRMADACFAAGNEKAAWRWIDRALDADKDAVLIHLSAACRLAGMGHRPIGHTLSLDPGSPAAKRQQRHLRRAAEISAELPLVGRIARHLSQRLDRQV